MAKRGAKTVGTAHPAHKTKGRSKFENGTKAAGIAAIKRITNKLGRSPSSSMVKGRPNKYVYETHREDGEPCAGMIMEVFGTWNKALEAAGVPLNEQPNENAVKKGFGAAKYTDAELLEAIRTVNARLPEGHVLRVDLYEELKRDGEPSGCTIRKRFRNTIGTWAEVREYALRDYNPAHVTAYASFTARILEAVRRVRKS